MNPFAVIHTSMVSGLAFRVVAISGVVRPHEAFLERLRNQARSRLARRAPCHRATLHGNELPRHNFPCTERLRPPGGARCQVATMACGRFGTARLHTIRQCRNFVASVSKVLPSSELLHENITSDTET
jgi:hypothetical protein